MMGQFLKTSTDKGKILQFHFLVFTHLAGQMAQNKPKSLNLKTAFKPVGKSDFTVAGLPRRDQGHQPDPEVQVQELCHRAACTLCSQEHPDGSLTHR